MRVASATVIEVGDLIYQDPSTKQAKPASAQADQGTLAGNQELFTTNFVGVSADRSPSGTTTDITVLSGGVFEMDCASATFSIGDRVGVAETAAGTALEDQKVIAVAATSPKLAIGRVEKERTSADTSVYVKIKSTLLDDGPQAIASGS
jgi:hypothetical protein